MDTRQHILMQPHRNHQAGISLIEILIGVTIGLIGILMMYQLTENWSIRKRTTAAGSDAQASGSIGSYRLTDDIRQAGYGFGTAGTKIGCSISAYDDAGISPRATVNLLSFLMVPVVIQNGTTGNPNGPDSLSIFYGNGTTLSSSHRYTDSTLTTKKTATQGPRTGIHRGDVVIVSPDTANCGLVRITDNTNSDGLTIEHANANSTYTDETGAGNQTRYNNPAGYLGAIAPGSVGTIYNVGDSPKLNMWRVSGRVLQECNYLDADCLDPSVPWNNIAEGIIDLQAQYGLDTDNNYIVDKWVDPDAPTTTLPGAVPLPGGVLWSRLRAVRVALLARSQEYEKTAVTLTAPLTGWVDAANHNVPFTMYNVDGSPAVPDDTPNDWRHYRYRLYTTTIPLRNMVWGTMPRGTGI